MARRASRRRRGDDRDLNASEELGDNDNWSSGSIGTNDDARQFDPGLPSITTLRNAASRMPLREHRGQRHHRRDEPDTRFDYVLHRASHLIYLGGSVFDTKQHSAAQLAALNGERHDLRRR